MCCIVTCEKSTNIIFWNALYDTVRGQQLIVAGQIRHVCCNNLFLHPRDVCPHVGVCVYGVVHKHTPFNRGPRACSIYATIRCSGRSTKGSMRDAFKLLIATHTVQQIGACMLRSSSNQVQGRKFPRKTMPFNNRLHT